MEKSIGLGRKKDSIFYNLSKLPMPEESFGVCSNARNCRNWKVILGNGLCVKCWDKGVKGKRYPNSSPITDTYSNSPHKSKTKYTFTKD